jgi:2-polyprenyl-3-methyl-5-hydroxy-6-metoxy-1,4-benzoquinol methylase
MKENKNWSANEWQIENNDKGFTLVKSFYNSDIIEKFLKEGSSVLDIGCGNGRIFREHKERIDSYTGVDIDLSGCLDLFKDKKCSFYKNLDVLINKKKKFGLIFMVDVIEHVATELLKEYILNMNKLLEEGGLIIISTPNYEYCFPNLTSFYDNPEHTRPYNTVSIKKLFRSYNVERRYITPYLNPIKIIINLLLYQRWPYLNIVWILERKNNE